MSDDVTTISMTENMADWAEWMIDRIIARHAGSDPTLPVIEGNLLHLPQEVGAIEEMLYCLEVLSLEATREAPPAAARTAITLAGKIRKVTGFSGIVAA